jgi:hypothetical protein
MVVLVLAIGTVFIPGSAEATSLRAIARQWVYAAQRWLSAPLEKPRMNVRGLKIQFLLILTRETIGIGSDLIWASIGTLIRTAMQLGYHRDPQTFQGMSPLTLKCDEDSGLQLWKWAYRQCLILPCHH